MKTLSKSRLIAFRQCPKRLWLEVHRPELREDSSAAQARFSVGHTVGELARRLYDPKGRGEMIDAARDGYAGALARTAALLRESRPIFEAGFSAGGVLAFADIVLKRRRAGELGWHVVEVKSSGSVKDYQRDDLAIQGYAMRSGGFRPAGLAVAHVDGKWVYPGNEDYAGIFRELDLTAESLRRSREVRQWTLGALEVAASPREPRIGIGAHCSSPFACGFFEYCSSTEPPVEYPVTWLPRAQAKALKAHLADPGVRDMRDVPDELLNERQLRVKTHTLGNRAYFDARGAADAIAVRHSLPARFLDFETVAFTVPIWKGTRPFQQIPFQFSVHVLGRDRELRHVEFLDLSGADPSRRLAEALLSACGERGPIYVYSAAFEASRIRELAERFAGLRPGLRALLDRLVDLRPVVEDHYYHPAQQGSWSIKAVLPTIAPDLAYENLEGVRAGGAAMDAYFEAINPQASSTRKAQIAEQLREYCKRDTLALVRVWHKFSAMGRDS